MPLPPAAPAAIGRDRAGRGVGLSALSAVLAALFFAAAADGLGMLLHLIGVMPLVP